MKLRENDKTVDMVGCRMFCHTNNYCLFCVLSNNSKKRYSDVEHILKGD